MRRAFTLVEICVVIAILAVIAAITFPVMGRAKQSAKVTVSTERLRQLYLATKIYQEENGGDGVYGRREAMNLPDPMYVYFQRFGMPQQSIESACGKHPSWIGKYAQIIFYVGDDGDQFEAHARNFRENLVMYYDMHCNDPSIDIRQDSYRSKLGLGVLHSGQVMRKTNRGLPHDPKFWSEPPKP